MEVCQNIRSNIFSLEIISVGKLKERHFPVQAIFIIQEDKKEFLPNKKSCLINFEFFDFFPQKLKKVEKILKIDEI